MITLQEIDFYIGIFGRASWRLLFRLTGRKKRTSETCEAVPVIANVLQNILNQRLCSWYAECIINGLMLE